MNMVDISEFDGSVKYNGEMNNNERNGYGIYQVNCIKYEGQFVNDKKHGHGILTTHYAEEDANYKFVGEFKDDHKHGLGTYTSNYTTSTGTWSNGYRNGYFEEKSVNYDEDINEDVVKYTEIYEGNYVNGKRTGVGKLINVRECNGEKLSKTYEGNFLNELYHGTGIITYANGDSYNGTCEYNKLSHGTYTFANGTAYTGNWLHCQLVGICTKISIDGTITTVDAQSLQEINELIIDNYILYSYQH